MEHIHTERGSYLHTIPGLFQNDPTSRRVNKSPLAGFGPQPSSPGLASLVVQHDSNQLVLGSPGFDYGFCKISGN